MVVEIDEISSVSSPCMLLDILGLWSILGVGMLEEFFAISKIYINAEEAGFLQSDPGYQPNPTTWF